MLQIIGELIGALQRGRTSLIIPKKKAIDELMKGRNMVITIALTLINVTINNS